MKLRWELIQVAIMLGATLVACTGPVDGVLVERSVPGGDRAVGRQLIASYGCGSCHDINGIPDANATVGPPLNDFYARTYIAGSLPNSWEYLSLWIQDPQGIEPGTTMPNLGVTEEEARHMAAYLYDQPRSFWSFGE